MKKIIYSLLSVIVLTITLNSCVKDTDYETPQITCEEPEIASSQLTSIQNVLASWHAANPNAGDRNLVSFVGEDANALYVSGYVVSDDRTGNFYKELFIQDKAENPDYAVKIAIDMRSMFTRFDFGRKIYLKLNGLGINKSHGEIMIGEVDGGDIKPIKEKRAKKTIIRSCQASVITPKSLNSVNDITSDMMGMFVKLNEMQFDLSLKGKPFVDPSDNYDTHRRLVSCADNADIMLETSSFASFKENVLPENQGSLVGILSRDYGDHFNVIRVNNVNAFNFDGSRCDPAMLDCTGATGTATTVFSEDFESYNNNDTNITGWTNVNTNGGNTLFKVGSYSGNKFVKCSAYNSGENPLEVWLITPPINLDNSTGEELSFKTKTGYNNGAALSVYVSTDFTGNAADISSATWLLVNTTIANGPSSGYGSFVEGTANVSCLNGNMYVAFKYSGGDGAITTTFQVDDVKVTAN